MSTPIKGKISNIIDQYTVALNIGQKAQVSVGMEFKIVARVVEIKDPETKEVLGKMEFEKDRVQVTQVFEKFCIAETSQTIAESLIPMFSFSTAKQKKLHIEQDLQELDRTVRIGDEVVQIVEQPKPPK